ncbi:MAG: type II secretion system major pseudopilin GspG [Candidatus Sumerlaeaceae bacterium]|nr:type II secretion system major pseudopilin GspG [Candidatus Sumerlaeaceae bacterium]
MMKRWIYASRNRGFTFIEIMLVVVIIGILMAVIVPRMSGRTRGAQASAAKMSIKGISTALGSFEVKAGRFPTSQEGLQALVTKPNGLNDDEWDGPYLSELPKDPWKEEFIYKSPGERNKDFDLVSKGPNKTEGDDDDIGNYSKDAPAAGDAGN